MHPLSFQPPSPLPRGIGLASQHALRCAPPRAPPPYHAQKRALRRGMRCVLGAPLSLDIDADLSTPAASGSFGEVFFGTLRCGEDVVLKRARGCGTSRALLAQEGAVNARLRARGVAGARWPAYLGSFSRQSTPYLVWRGAGAGAATLEEYLSARPTHALGDALGASEPGGARVRARAFRTVVGELLRAVDALADARLVHRDVKPANVLVVPGAARPLQLIDFGAAMEMTAPPWRRRVHAVDPLYAPPERWVSGRAPDRFDVFCIALVGMRVLLPGLSAGRLREFRERLMEKGCCLHRMRREGVGMGVQPLFEGGDPVMELIFDALAAMLVENPVRRSSASRVLSMSPLFR